MRPIFAGRLWWPHSCDETMGGSVHEPLGGERLHLAVRVGELEHRGALPHLRLDEFFRSVPRVIRRRM
jgi:hypothetical protein